MLSQHQESSHHLHQLPNFSNSFDPSSTSSIKDDSQECYSFPMNNSTNNALNNSNNNINNTNNSYHDSFNNSQSQQSQIGEFKILSTPSSATPPPASSESKNSPNNLMPDYQTLQDMWPPHFYPYSQHYPVNCQYPQSLTSHHNSNDNNNPNPNNTNTTNNNNNTNNNTSTNNNNNNNPYIPQHQIPSDNSNIWNHMRSLSNTMDQLPLNPGGNNNAAAAAANLSQQFDNFSKLDYNSIFQFPYMKPDGVNLTHNRSIECVRCGILTGNFWHKDQVGNYLCQSCFSPNTSASPPSSATLDLLNKRASNLNSSVNMQKNLSRKQTAKRTGLLCFNCKTENTTLWRRNSDGQQVCNACGLYFKLHKTNRPTSMRKEVLQTRKRKTKRKSNVGLKYMDQDYPVKPEMLNPIDSQLLSVNSQQQQQQQQPDCLMNSTHDTSPYRHHNSALFDLSQTQSYSSHSNLMSPTQLNSSLIHHQPTPQHQSNFHPSLHLHQQQQQQQQLLHNQLQQHHQHHQLHPQQYMNPLHQHLQHQTQQMEFMV